MQTHRSAVRAQFTREFRAHDRSRENSSKFPLVTDRGKCCFFSAATDARVDSADVVLIRRCRCLIRRCTERNFNSSSQIQADKLNQP